MPPKVVLTPRQIKSLVHMRNHGSTFIAIGERFGISESAAHRIYKENTTRPKSKAHRK